MTRRNKDLLAGILSAMVVHARETSVVPREKDASAVRKLDLEEVRLRYERELYDRIVPFWENHSIDRGCGGYLHCLDRDGAVYDTFKDIWMEWREVYMFAALVNHNRRKPEWIGLARHGYDSLLPRRLLECIDEFSASGDARQ